MRSEDKPGRENGHPRFSVKTMTKVGKKSRRLLNKLLNKGVVLSCGIKVRLRRKDRKRYEWVQ